MENITMRDAFFNALYDIAKQDRNVILISADMGAPSLDVFRRDLGSQFINVGIAEANMVTVATGLALSGKTVFIYAIMPFVTSRCYEMLKVDLSLMNVAVTAIGVGAGFSYDDSGPTHHSTEDLSIMRALPNMTIWNASDSIMAAHLAEMACQTTTPAYVRLDRQVLPVLYAESAKEDFSQGLTPLKTGKDVCIIATGNMVHNALTVAEQLAAQSIDAGVIDLYRLKPLNIDGLLTQISHCKRLVTLEEHLLIGGLGSAVAELLVDSGVSLPLKRFGVQDAYIYAYGGRENIQRLCNIDIETVTWTIVEWIS
jgi:transketolase